MTAIDAAARHVGRERAVQWLYQWELSGLDLDDVCRDVAHQLLGCAFGDQAAVGENREPMTALASSM